MMLENMTPSPPLCPAAVGLEVCCVREGELTECAGKWHLKATASLGELERESEGRKRRKSVSTDPNIL